jgi:hypothetical protein
MTVRFAVRASLATLAILVSAAGALDAFPPTAAYACGIFESTDSCRPGTPTEVGSYAVDDHSVVLSWRNAASEAVTFEVEQIRGPTEPYSPAITPIAGVRSTSVTIRGLAGCTHYAFRVWARNISDDLRSKYPSAESGVQTKCPPSIISVTAEARGPRTIVVRWVAPVDDQAPVDRFWVYMRQTRETDFSLDENRDTVVADEGRDTREISRTVEPNTRYCFGVQAYGPYGRDGLLGRRAACARTIEVPHAPNAQSAVPAGALGNRQQVVNGATGLLPQTTDGAQDGGAGGGMSGTTTTRPGPRRAQ